VRVQIAGGPFHSFEFEAGDDCREQSGIGRMGAVIASLFAGGDVCLALILQFPFRLRQGQGDGILYRLESGAGLLDLRQVGQGVLGVGAGKDTL